LNILSSFKKESDLKKKLQELNLSQENIKFFISIKNLDSKENYKLKESKETKFNELINKMYTELIEYFPFLQTKINLDILYIPDNLMYYSGLFFEVICDRDKYPIIKGGR
jgi:histidyl-tRNA synthetase